MPIFSLPSIGGWLAVVSLALAPSCADAMDLNRASQSELQSLQGVGAKTAALIVQERARGGPYESLENLAERVRGVGHKKAAALAKAGLRVGRTDSPQAPGRAAVSPGVIIVPAPSDTLSAAPLSMHPVSEHPAPVTRPRRPMTTP